MLLLLLLVGSDKTDSKAALMLLSKALFSFSKIDVCTAVPDRHHIVLAETLLVAYPSFASLLTSPEHLAIMSCIKE